MIKAFVWKLWVFNSALFQGRTTLKRIGIVNFCLCVGEIIANLVFQEGYMMLTFPYAEACRQFMLPRVLRQTLTLTVSLQ